MAEKNIRRISSGSPFEGKVGYSRAVVFGDLVYVAGTVGQGETVVDQCKEALATIERALHEAGTDFSRVLRVTYMLPDKDEFEPCWPLLKATFGDNPPAATMIECELIDPIFRIEIEVTAALP